MIKQSPFSKVPKYSNMPTSVSFSKFCQRYKCSFKIFKDYSRQKFSLGSRAPLYKSRPSCNKDNDDDGGVGGSHDNDDDDDGVGVDGDDFDLGMVLQQI